MPDCIHERRLSILKLCYEYPPIGGGGGRVALGLSRQLADMGHAIDIVTMAYKGLPLFESNGNVSIHRMRCIRTSPIICHSPEMLTYICLSLPKVLQMVRRKRYDLIHAHFIFPDGVLAYIISGLTGLPYLITAHGSDVPGYNPDRFVFLHKALSPLWRVVIRSSSRVVCLSRYLECLLKKVSPETDTLVIPNGFDIGRFRPDREKTGRILVVTRMFKRKGIQHFINAVNGLDIDQEIHIIGDGPYLSRLKKLAENTSAKIYFHDFLDNSSEKFKDLIETASIFVFPSESENFPIVLLEAMSAGLAIITTKNTGCQEVVGNTCLLVKPGDPDEIRQALLSYLRSPLLQKQHGALARKRLETHFSWETVARRYVKVYETIRNHKLISGKSFVDK
jgi:glycosyltransferase involved in cell wall biosynthesis